MRFFLLSASNTHRNLWVHGKPRYVDPRLLLWEPILWEFLNLERMQRKLHED